MNEQFSAWIDGELEASEADWVLAELQKKPELQKAWQEQHLLGDAMRDTPCLSAGFNAKLQAALAQEPIINQKVDWLAQTQAPAPQAHLQQVKPAPKQSNLRTYFASAIAAVAGVAFVGWLVIGGNPASKPTSIVPPAGVAVVPSAIPVNQAAQLVDYEQVHQQMAGNLGGVDDVAVPVASVPASAIRSAE